MVPNFLYSNSYYLFNIIIIVIIIHYIIRILSLPTCFSLGGNATEPTIFQQFEAKFVNIVTLWQIENMKGEMW